MFILQKVFWTDCKPSKEDRIFRTNRGNGKSQCDNGNGPIKDRSSDVTKECMSFNIKTLKYKKRKCMKSKLQDIPGFCLVKEEPTVTTFAPTTPAPCQYEIIELRIKRFREKLYGKISQTLLGNKKGEN